jgi:hypothetical protein
MAADILERLDWFFTSVS